MPGSSWRYCPDGSAQPSFADRAGSVLPPINKETSSSQLPCYWSGQMSDRGSPDFSFCPLICESPLQSFPDPDVICNFSGAVQLPGAAPSIKAPVDKVNVPITTQTIRNGRHHCADQLSCIHQQRQAVILHCLKAVVGELEFVGFQF